MTPEILESGRSWLVVALALLAGALAACSGVEPFEYTEVHEIPPGPGLISGEDGEFELYRGNGNDSGNQDESENPTNSAE